MVQTIPNTAKVQWIKYTPSFSSICSIGKAPFTGEIEIIYQPEARLIEFQSFDAWLFTLASQSMTIEDLTREVFDTLTVALGSIPLRVTVHATSVVHAPASATIERSQIK